MYFISLVLFLFFEISTCNLWEKGVVHYSINTKDYDPHSQDVMMETFRKIQSAVCVKFFNMPANHTADSQRVLYIHNPNREKLCPPRSYDFNRTVVDMIIGYKCVNERDIVRLMVDMLKASIHKSENIVNSYDLLKKFQEKDMQPDQTSVLNTNDRNYINAHYFHECGGLTQPSAPSRRRVYDEDASSEYTPQNRQYYQNKVWPMGIVVYKVAPKLRTSPDFTALVRVMHLLESQSCVMFQEAAVDDVLDPMNVVSFEEDGERWPNLGFLEGVQTLKLSSIARCEDPGHSSHALMMMMRILGLPMMSNRYDRDNYVKIHWKNVQKGEELYLEKAPEAAWLKSIPYDFTSVTHAPANFLCPGCLTTYTVEPVQDHLWHRTLQMGHPTKLSPDDVNLIRVVYAEERTSILKPNVPQPTEKSEADDKEYDDGEDEINEPDESVTRRTDVDNSQYVKGESRYIWFPDGNRMPSLVDLQAPIPAANGTTSPNVYLLFTRSNPVNPQVIEIENASTASNSNYDAKKPLVVIVHGWMSDRHSEINVLVRDAFLEAHDVNVIILDWTKKAGKLYTIAMSAVPRVGRSLAEFLSWLIETCGGDWNKVHLVGFSLGAHVVGKAGKITGGKPARVTVLDPAGPLWDGKEARDTISVAGQYVEAIHTNGDALGLYQKVAHADFYPNGGKIQPGCDCIDSHCRAYELFAATVRKNHLVGYSCDDMKQALEVQCSGSALNMGNGNFYKRGNGIYGLKTDKKWPY